MRQLTVVPLMVWLGAIGLVLGLVVVISSCATRPLPECVRYEYRIAQDADGQVYRVLDAEDLEKLHALIMGLAHGTCRLPTKPAPRRTEQLPEPPRKGLDT